MIMIHPHVNSGCELLRDVAPFVKVVQRRSTKLILRA